MNKLYDTAFVRASAANPLNGKINFLRVARGQGVTYLDGAGAAVTRNKDFGDTNIEDNGKVPFDINLSMVCLSLHSPYVARTDVNIALDHDAILNPRNLLTIKRQGDTDVLERIPLDLITPMTRKEFYGFNAEVNSKLGGIGQVGGLYQIPKLMLKKGDSFEAEIELLDPLILPSGKTTAMRLIFF